MALPTTNIFIRDTDISPGMVSSFKPLSCWPKVLPDTVSTLYTLIHDMTALSGNPAGVHSLSRSIRASLAQVYHEIDLALEAMCSQECASPSKPSEHRRRAIICVDLFAIHVSLLASKWVISQIEQGYLDPTSTMHLEEYSSIIQALERLAVRLLDVLVSSYIDS